MFSLSVMRNEIKHVADKLSEDRVDLLKVPIVLFVTCPVVSRECLVEIHITVQKSTAELRRSALRRRLSYASADLKVNAVPPAEVSDAW